MLVIDEYQSKIQKYRHINASEEKAYYCLALAEECGEVISLVKKLFFRNEPNQFFRENMQEELGDVLCILSLFASYYDLDMQRIMETNLYKVQEKFK